MGGGGVAKSLDTIGSLGLNQLPGVGGQIGSAMGYLDPVGLAIHGAAAGVRTVDGLGTPAKTIADSMGVLQGQQTAAAADASRKLLETPKNITPDNFLSMKAKQLAQLRLGMGGGMAPGGSAPLLSSTALSGADPSKKKLLGQ